MIDFTPGDGPSDETLQRIRGMMDSKIQGMASGRIGGKGIPVVKKAGRPKSACSICSTAFDTPPGDAPKVAHCSRCDALLKEGYAALVSPERFAFVRSAKFQPGEVIPISEAIMTRVEDKFKDSIKRKQKEGTEES